MNPMVRIKQIPHHTKTARFYIATSMTEYLKSSGNLLMAENTLRAWRLMARTPEEKATVSMVIGIVKTHPTDLPKLIPCR